MKRRVHKTSGPSDNGDRTRRRLQVLVGALALSACAAPNLSRTVGRGNTEVHVSAGGPMFSRLGPTFPIPNVNVGGRVGATDWMDVDASVNALAAAYGILAVDVAGNFQLYRRPKGFALASSARLWTYSDLDDAPGFRAYPELALHLGGPIPRAPWLHPYGGVATTFSFRPPQGKPPVFINPFVGLEFLLRPRPSRRGGGRARQQGIALHLSWINPGPDTPSVVDYWPGRGALTVHLGYRVRFGGLDR